MERYAFVCRLALTLVMPILFLPNASGQSASCNTAYQQCVAVGKIASQQCIVTKMNLGISPNCPVYTQACTNALNACNDMYVYPKFRVISALYVPPGNQSSVAYAQTTTAGSSTSDTNSFTTTTSGGAGFKIAGFSLGTTFTLANIDTTVTTDQTTAQNTGTTTFKSTSDPIDHTHDVFTIWLNPQLTASSFLFPCFWGQSLCSSSASIFQTTGNAKYNPASVAEMPDAPGDATSVVTVSVAQLQNPTTIPAGALVSQTLDGTIVPGLLKLCANRISENQCTTAQVAANGCGCQASDFAAIVQQDPFFDPAVLARTSTPGIADVNAVDPDSARFVQVVDTNNNPLLMTLAGPGSGSTSTQTENITDTNNTSNTYTHTVTKTVGVTFGYSTNAPKDDPSAFTWNVSLGNNLSWSQSKSIGNTSSNAHSQTVTLGTTTPSCYTNIAVYEDTAFHTYAFQSTSNVQNPCP